MNCGGVRRPRASVISNRRLKTRFFEPEKPSESARVSIKRNRFGMPLPRPWARNHQEHPQPCGRMAEPFQDGDIGEYSQPIRRAQAAVMRNDQSFQAYAKMSRRSASADRIAHSRVMAPMSTPGPASRSVKSATRRPTVRPEWCGENPFAAPPSYRSPAGDVFPSDCAINTRTPLREEPFLKS